MRFGIVWRVPTVASHAGGDSIAIKPSIHASDETCWKGVAFVRTGQDDS